MSELIAQLPPGPELIAELGSLPDELSDADRIDAVAAWDRVISWAEAHKHAAVHALAGQTASPGHAEIEHVRMALGLSRQGARNQVTLAERLHNLFPRTFDLFARGLISRGHVWALFDATRELDDETAGLVEDAVIAEASLQTIAEMRRALAHAVIAADPRTAEERYDHAVRRRELVRWRDRDGIGGLGARLAAEDLESTWAAVDARAREICGPDDPRGRAALRADALVELLTGRPAAHDPRLRPDTPATADEPDWLDDTAEALPPTTEVQVVMTPADLEPRSAGRSAARPVSSGPTVVVGLGTLQGTSHAPAELRGHGAVPATVARRLAAAPVLLRRLLVDPETGALIDGELTIPLEAITSPRQALLPPTAETLLRAPPKPPPEHHPGYRPPSALERHIDLRDRRCTVWGCGQPATCCDIDHGIPHPHGPTSRENCGLLCRWHHRLKTLFGWRLTRSATDTTWAAPTGHARRRRTYDYRRFLVGTARMPVTD